MTARLCLALLAAGLASTQAVAAEVRQPATAIRSDEGPTADNKIASQPPSGGANFRGEIASGDAREVANWAVSSGDSHGLPFMIVDKRNAKVFLFDGRGQLKGAAPALLGLGRGDESVAGIGQRRLATISPKERTTPAGRFEASLGHDFEQDILWVDYDSALSLHRVIVGDRKDRRRQRLASASPLDNRISYGCINVPVDFYDRLVIPAFTATVGIVYILPETKSVGEVFAIPAKQGPIPKIESASVAEASSPRR